VEPRACPPEETLAEFLEQRLSADEAASVTRHIDECTSCRVALGAMAEPSPVDPAEPVDNAEAPAVLRPGDRLGPYAIEGWLGGGAMGDIYQAFDERLQRRLAVKRVRRKVGSPEAEQRLWREAQALAKLRHPNVVAVHDVGVTDGRAWIAMELVEGETLRQWAAKRQPVAEVLAVFRQAAQGLAAAHAAGIVHRDFKPENVLVGRDGRAQVTDFGLAESAGTEDPAVLSGTPAYMSPEQTEGGKADPRADQYAFCVALYEALEGERPAVGAPQWKSGAPRNVKQAVERGLSRAPGQRFASIDELARQLEPMKSRPVWMFAAAAVVIAAVAGGALSYRRSQLCTSGPSLAAQTWNTQRRAALTEAVSKLGTPFASETAARVAPLLDQWALDWSHAFVDRCEATHFRGEQSEQVLDAQVRCLEAQRRKVSQLVDVLEHSPAGDGLVKAVPAFFAIDPVGECLVAHGASAVTALPVDRAEATRVEAVRSELDQAGVLETAGRNVDALARVKALEPEVTRLAFKPLAAQYQLDLARAYVAATQPDAAQPLLSQAFASAVALGDDELAFDATVSMAEVLGAEKADFDGARAKLVEARAWLNRLGSPPKKELELSALEGYVELHSGDYAKSRPALERALQLARAAKPVNPEDLATALVNLGALEYGSLKPDAAEPLAREAIEVAARAFGEHHRLTADARQVMGQVLYEQGKWSEALEQQQQALDARKEATPHDTEVGDAELDVAQTLVGWMRHKEAEVHEREALRIHQAAHLDELAATDEVALGSLLGDLGRFDEATAMLNAALKWREEHLGADHRDVGAAAYALGEVQLSSDHYREAEALFRRALKVDERMYGEDSELAAVDWSGIGKAIAREGKLNDGEAMLAKAEAMVAKASPASTRLAGIQINRAWMLLEQKKYDAALELLKTVEASKPAGWMERVRTSWLIQRALNGLHRPKEAEPYLATARTLLAEHPEIWMRERER
jgi:tetratricopeptide (TPR) repeat protein